MFSIFNSYLLFEANENSRRLAAELSINVKRVDITQDPYELCPAVGIKIHYYDLDKEENTSYFFYYQS